jgi:flagellar hook-associated protein 3
MSGWGAIYNNSMYGLYEQSSQIARLSEQATTGARVNRASDDPTAAYQIMHLLDESATYQSYIRNIGGVGDNLTNADTILQQVSSDIATVQQSATQMATNSYNDQQRTVMAGQIDSLLQECVSLANSQQAGQYTFSGDAATTQPYKTVLKNGKIVDVVYQGGKSELTVPVAPGVAYSGTLVGSEVFGLHDRQAPVLADNTLRLSVGSGTSTAHASSGWTCATPAPLWDRAMPAFPPAAAPTTTPSWATTPSAWTPTPRPSNWMMGPSPPTPALRRT